MSQKNENKRRHPVVKWILIALAICIVVPIAVVGGYVGYVAATYYRVGNIDLTVEKNSENTTVERGKVLTMTTYNVGFGAYSPEYTFFMDTGYDENGDPTSGKYGKGMSREDVAKNTEGSRKLIETLNSDFFALQEVDIDADRSYHIDQKEILSKAIPSTDSTFAQNFDTGYLFYPFNDPHGKTKAGLTTLSKYQIREAKRMEYTISTGFSKYFDLDRCFAVHRLTVDADHDFVFINSHMSAYDEGGMIRDKQLNELYSFMKSEYDKGNYVIAAGDFNHDLLTNNPNYSYTLEDYPYRDQIRQQRPDWLSYMFDQDRKSYFDDGFVVAAANNEPSCRDCDVTWKPGYTFVSTVDGFIVSKNIKIDSVETYKSVENGFAFSDHQPSTLKFELI